MATNERASALLQELGGLIGIGDLTLDEDGAATLVLDGGAAIVTLGARGGEDALHLMCCLDTVEPGPAVLREMLRANFLGGAGRPVFALEPGSDAVVLQQSVPLEGLTGAGLARILEQFGDTALRLQQALEAEGEDPGRPDGDRPSGGLLPMMLA
ncbi:MAG: type III secretion system chaperone [Dongiaceae bacterium]